MKTCTHQGGKKTETDGDSTGPGVIVWSKTFVKTKIVKKGMHVRDTIRNFTMEVV